MDLKEEGLHEVAERIEYPPTQVLEILRLMDYQQKNPKYKGIKFNPKEPEGIFTITEDFSNQKRDVVWTEIEEKIQAAHKNNKKVYSKTKNLRDKHKFIVFHSAQDVTYDLKQFRDRNIDYIP